MIYVGCPYSHKWRRPVWFLRYYLVTYITAALMRDNPEEVYFSPITHSHPLQAKNLTPHTYEYWVDIQDEGFMDVSYKMVAVLMPGWSKSPGLAHELRHFRIHSKQIESVDPYDFELPWRGRLARWLLYKIT